jgi:DNA-directed RNA polymerase sigma subunit (sigma70/sigma32)
LTPNDIAVIRLMSGTLREIAAEFGVSHELVRQVKS